MSVSFVAAQIRGARLTDVLVSGFLDSNEEVTRFRALWDLVFLEFDDRILLEVSAVRADGDCILSVVDRLRPYPELGDDMIPAFSSLGLHVIPEPDNENRVVSLSLWAPVKEGGGVRCGAVGIGLECGAAGRQEVFLDPWHHWGFRVGGAWQRQAWEANRQELAGTEVVVRFLRAEAGRCRTSRRGAAGGTRTR